MMNPFQLALLNAKHRRLERYQAYKEYGYDAVEGLLSHKYVELRGEYLAVTEVGRRALADFEFQVDRK